MVPNVAQETTAGSWGGFEYSVSESGTLVYLPDAAVAIRRTLVWVDRQGHEEPLTAEPRAYQYPRISPDGQRVLVEARDQENDLWTWDLSGTRLTRVTFGRYAGGPGTWTRDGRSVVYGPDHGGIINLVQQLLDSPDSVKPLVTSPNTQYADASSPDGRWLVYEETDPATKFDLRVLALDGSHESKPLLNGPYNEQNPDISPDGRWLAFQSDESGRVEIYVRPFPDVAAGRWPVSTRGGTRPLWSRDGRELFYLNEQRQLVVVSVGDRTGFHVGAAQTLFDTKPYGTYGINRNFDAAPDGKRFIFTKTLPTSPDAKRLIVVENWTEELKQRVPTK
jgi:serine/threonine-protein kinase